MTNEGGSKAPGACAVRSSLIACLYLFSAIALALGAVGLLGGAPAEGVVLGLAGVGALWWSWKYRGKIQAVQALSFALQATQRGDLDEAERLVALASERGRFGSAAMGAPLVRALRKMSAAKRSESAYRVAAPQNEARDKEVVGFVTTFVADAAAYVDARPDADAAPSLATASASASPYEPKALPKGPSGGASRSFGPRAERFSSGSGSRRRRRPRSRRRCCSRSSRSRRSLRSAAASSC